MVYAGRLEEQGFHRANMVLGKFLLLGQSEELFVPWLQSVARCNNRYAWMCWRALNEWSAQTF